MIPVLNVLSQPLLVNLAYIAVLVCCAWAMFQLYFFASLFASQASRDTLAIELFGPRQDHRLDARLCSVHPVYPQQAYHIASHARNHTPSHDFPSKVKLIIWTTGRVQTCNWQPPSDASMVHGNDLSLEQVFPKTPSSHRCCCCYNS